MTMTVKTESGPMQVKVKPSAMDTSKIYIEQFIDSVGLRFRCTKEEALKLAKLIQEQCENIEE